MGIVDFYKGHSYNSFSLARFIIEMCWKGSRLQQLPHNNDYNSKDDNENLHSGGGTASAAGGYMVFFAKLRENLLSNNVNFG
jgi:hypothetical protein